MLITWHKDIRNDTNWFGKEYRDSTILLIKIAEPLTKKPKSFKTVGEVNGFFVNGMLVRYTGKMLLYFSKDSVASSIHYGDMILLNKPLQQIRNSGNPGAFNYERYAAFQQIFHNVYLKENDFVLLQNKKTNPFLTILFSARKYVIDVLQKYLPDDKNVIGIAEALLIGYKEDLDKDLVQAYSNTGVVHIIAISGLHLGLIYVMLVWIFERVPLVKRSRVLKMLMILFCLWFFALLTGGSASVLRSAVMFTCIVIGKNYFKKSSILNSMAASAFMLLSFNPYFLWDVGFQLSYLAVFGIVWLQRPIYQLLYLKNALLNYTWSMASVALSAQLITFPVCIYYFHQFPNLFLLTNLFAVPLSTVILFSEIFLISFSWIPFISILTGKLVGILVWSMNFIIETCNGLSFSLWDNIYSNIFTTWLLYICIFSFCFWLLDNKKKGLKISLMAFIAFSFLHMSAKIKTAQQKKLVIYDVPQHQAVDFIAGDTYYTLGDSILLQDGLLHNFHLKPAHINLGVSKKRKTLNGLSHQNNYWQFYNKGIMIIDTGIQYKPLENKFRTDVLLISKNPNLNIAGIFNAIRPSVIVFDSSNSLWKIAKWKKECLALALPCFSIPEQGAFVLNID